MESTTQKSPLTVIHKNLSPEKEQISYWCNIYLTLVVNGSSRATFEAKKTDLSKFLDFANSLGLDDQVQRWTPTLSKSFQESMLAAYSPASVARMCATLSHFSKWLLSMQPLAFGDPMSGLTKIKLEEPSWNGLSPRDIYQLKMAVDMRLATCKRRDQNPLLEAAVFYLLLYTGLRESELINLNFGQYQGSRALKDVRRKGKRVSKKITVPKDATIHLENYLKDKRRAGDDPLFMSRGEKRLKRLDVYNICQRIAALTPTQIKLSPHMLRHTFLKRVTDKHGVHVAQKLSGNTSVREIFRYARPSEKEMEQVVEGLF